MLGKWIFAQMRDMTLSEVTSREVTRTSISSSVGHRVDWILTFRSS